MPGHGHDTQKFVERISPRCWLGREVTDRRTRVLCAAQEVFAIQGFRSAEAFFDNLRGQGYFQALSTRESIHLMVNVMIGAIYTWALTGAGDLEEQAIRYLRVLIKGLRTDPQKINRQPKRG